MAERVRRRTIAQDRGNERKARLVIVIVDCFPEEEDDRGEGKKKRQEILAGVH